MRQGRGIRSICSAVICLLAVLAVVLSDHFKRVLPCAGEALTLRNRARNRAMKK